MIHLCWSQDHRQSPSMTLWGTNAFHCHFRVESESTATALALTDHICDSLTPPTHTAAGPGIRFGPWPFSWIFFFFFLTTARRARRHGAWIRATAPVKPVTVQEEFIQFQQLMNICSALVALRSVVPWARRRSQLIMSNPQVQPASVLRQEKEIRTNFLFATCAIPDQWMSASKCLSGFYLIQLLNLACIQPFIYPKL